MVAPKEIDKGMTRLHELFDELLTDMYRSFEVLESDRSSQALRRNTVRAVFSAMEGILSIVRDEILRKLRRTPDEERSKLLLTAKDREILTEKKLKDGVEKVIYPSLTERVKKYFPIASKVFALNDYSFEASGTEFESFEIAKKTRDRLAHPRDYYDIQVTDTEMHHLVVTIFWIEGGMLDMFRSRIQKSRSELPEWAIEGWDELFKGV